MHPWRTPGRPSSRRHQRAASPRTKWTRRVPHPVLIGHAASLTRQHPSSCPRSGRVRVVTSVPPRALVERPAGRMRADSSGRMGHCGCLRQVIEREYGAQGLNIAIQDGRASGQSVPHVGPPHDRALRGAGLAFQECRVAPTRWLAVCEAITHTPSLLCPLDVPLNSIMARFLGPRPHHPPACQRRRHGRRDLRQGVLLRLEYKARFDDLFKYGIRSGAASLPRLLGLRALQCSRSVRGADRGI